MVLCVSSINLLKTIREKEKLLGMSYRISPFPTVFSIHMEIFLPFSSNLELSQAMVFMCLQHKSCGNTVEKKKIMFVCSLPAISPFLTMFSTHLEIFMPFLSNLVLSSANSFNLEDSGICIGKGLSAVLHWFNHLFDTIWQCFMVDICIL